MKIIQHFSLASRHQVLNAYKLHYASTKDPIVCFYNSAIDLYFQDQDLMLIPFTDRIVNRAHGVMEACYIRSPYKISDQIGTNLSRLENSAKLVGISLPLGRRELEEKLAKLIELSYEVMGEGERLMLLKILVSSGYGDFSIFCDKGKATVYAAVCELNFEFFKGKMECGVREFTHTELFTDADYLANAKTVNYLKNSIAANYSRERGGYNGIVLDEEGNILEGTISNIGFVLEDGTFGYPSLSKTIRGKTMVRTIEMVKEKLMAEGWIRRVGEVEVNVKALDRVREMFHTGNEKVIPIIEVNGEKIGDGSVGKVTRRLQEEWATR